MTQDYSYTRYGSAVNPVGKLLSCSAIEGVLDQGVIHPGPQHETAGSSRIVDVREVVGAHMDQTFGCIIGNRTRSEGGSNEMSPLAAKCSRVCTSCHGLLFVSMYLPSYRFMRLIRVPGRWNADVVS